MSLLTTRFMIVPILFYSATSVADVSSDVLLNRGASGSPTQSGLESGRYKSVQSEEDGVEKPPPIKKRTIRKKLASEKPPEALPDKSIGEPPTPVEKSDAKSASEPSVTDHVKEIFSGGNGAMIEEYREQVHPDDIRLNRIEIEMLPGLMYNNSSSNLSYRNYNSFAPTIGVGTNLWISPLVGISGGYLTSMEQDMPSNLGTRGRIAVKTEQIRAALEFRRFFGLSRRAISVNYGLHYSEWKLSVPSNETSRVQLKTSGLGLHLQVRMPTSINYSWIFEGSIDPQLSHSELQTGLNLSSGTGVDTSRVGLAFGGEFKLSRQNQVLWKLGAQLEKNQFSGSSNLPDPETGTTVQGVSVTNTLMLFSLGYRWGQ